MTLQDTYLYQLEVHWRRGRSGTVRAEGQPPIDVSAPPEFLGEPDLWSPEQLLVASVASCFMTTFLALAEIARLPVEGYRAHALGRLEKIPGDGYRFTEITLVPEITVAHDDVERALKVLAKAEKHCFVSKSLQATVQVEPKFVPAPAVVAG